MSPTDTVHTSTNPMPRFGTMPHDVLTAVRRGLLELTGVVGAFVATTTPVVANTPEIFRTLGGYNHAEPFLTVPRGRSSPDAR
jgi:hypothetical protein